MNGPEHYVQAEMLLAGCGFRDAEDAGVSIDPAVTPSWLAAAQVHATLAMAAAIGVDDVDGWQEVVQPAAPLVGVQADEPVAVESVHDRAALVAGLRQLADLIEANPDLPASPHQLSATVYINSMPHIGNDDELGFAELRRIAGILGVEPDLRDEPGAMHPSVRLRLAGGVAYEATYITQAYKRGYKPVEPEPDVVDGSPSDLDGPPAPVLDAAGYLSCGCLGTDTEHSCRDQLDGERADEPEFDGVHERDGGRAGGPGDCAAWCACGVSFDGFDTIAEAGALVDEHAATANAAPSGVDGGGSS